MIEEWITLRDAVPEDMQFLGRLYRDSRRREVEPWGWPPEQQEMFLEMQFNAQYRSYRATFPNAADSIICQANNPIGRVMVGQESASLRLIDIALLQEHRCRGIGGNLIRRLMQQCETNRLTLRLQVLRSNPAIRLYQRLGFVESSADSMYIQMEWIPSSMSEGV
jgi:ribosomal protein S18 acetylase RimI-like enzyme